MLSKGARGHGWGRAGVFSVKTGQMALVRAVMRCVHSLTQRAWLLFSVYVFFFFVCFLVSLFCYDASLAHPCHLSVPAKLGHLLLAPTCGPVSLRASWRPGAHRLSSASCGTSPCPIRLVPLFIPVKILLWFYCCVTGHSYLFHFSLFSALPLERLSSCCLPVTLANSHASLCV